MPKKNLFLIKFCENAEQIRLYFSFCEIVFRERFSYLIPLEFRIFRSTVSVSRV